MMNDSGRFAVETAGLSFSYGSPTVRDISLCLPFGTLTGIIGPNGSGKTTILRLLDGILSPHSGEIRMWDGVSLSALSRKEIARHIALVPQNGGGYLDYGVLEFALQGRSPHLSLFGFESRKDEEIAESALRMVQLFDYRHRRVGELSGGEKQRLLLARALAQCSRILLLDEFTSNLDVKFQVELMALVKRVTRERNLATLIASHEINLLAVFCDRIVLIDEGRILEQGPSREVLTRENLKALFGIDFLVRYLECGTPEISPILSKGSSYER